MESRRDFLKKGIAASGLAAAAALQQGCSQTNRAASESPSTDIRRVIWIVEDSLRADHLGYMGYDRDTSPWLDALASESIDFRLAIAPSDGTMRSVPSYLSGRNFSTIFREPLGKEGIPKFATSIFEAFKNAGVRTTLWTTNPHLKERAGFARGVDSFRQLLPINQPYAKIDEVTDTVINDYKPASGRELVYLHLMDSHLPYRAPIPFDRMFAPAEKYTRRVCRDGALWRKGGYVSSNHPYFSEDHDAQREDIDFLIGQYDGMIRYFDSRLERLLDALAYDPERDALVFCSDHGEQFLEHGWWAHNRSTLKEELHVPLLIRYPGCSARKVEHPITLLDVYPTLCELCDIPIPKTVSGRSLVADFAGEAAPRPYVYSEGSDDRGASGVVVDQSHLYYLNTDIRRHLPWRRWPFEELLFDIGEDPGCQSNLIDGLPDVAERMNGWLRDSNPRFRHATRNAIARTEDRLQMTGQLMKAVAHDAAATKQEFKARIADLAEPHYLEVDYTLVKGTCTLQFYNQEPKPIWEYECRKPTDGMRKLGVVLRPKNTYSTLAARFRGGTEVTIHDVRLRRLITPSIEIVPSDVPAEESESAAPLSQDERDRLEALGYLE